MNDVVLVDTDILIDHLRGHASMRERRIATWSYSVVARAELFGGTDEASKVRRLLDQGAELGVSTEVAERAGRIKRMCRIALPDAIIAATALVNDLLLVTRNEKHFQNVPGLRIEVPE